MRAVGPHGDERPWVTADDRTGALEIAAMLAGDGAPVLASSYPDLTGDVVDLGSRHLPAAVAESRAGVVPGAGRVWHAHKIDSLLRGNWPHELRARSRAAGRAAVVIAAWPAMGRTCVDGIVRVDGAPVGSVLEHLPEAVHVREPGALDDWWQQASADPTGVAVVDVADEPTLSTVARWAAHVDVLPVGPAGAVGEVAAARFGAPGTVEVPSVSGRVAVVCGSASMVAQRQLDRLRVDLPDVEVIAAPRPTDGDGLDEWHAAEVARRARPSLQGCGAVVIVGGDTAAALLGDGPRLVGGFAALGMPFSTSRDGAGPLVVTKAGAFGDDAALVEVVRRLRGASGTVRP